MKQSQKNNIINEIRKIYGESGYEGNDNWSSVRNMNIFQKANRNELYEALQASRGINLSVDNNFDANIEQVSLYMDKPFSNIDIRRHNEIIDIIDYPSIENVIELGFRAPRLLKYYRELGKTVEGIDVVKVNVLIAKYLGYNCSVHDLSLDKKLTLKNNSLIISYHCFEHIIDPQKALSKIFSSMSKDSYLHIEVPTEEVNNPNIKYAHCFAFHKGQLRDMLIKCGFKILFWNNTNYQCAICKK